MVNIRYVESDSGRAMHGTKVCQEQASDKMSTFQFMAFAAISISTVISVVQAINNNNNNDNNENNNNINETSFDYFTIRSVSRRRFVAHFQLRTSFCAP